MSFAYGTIASLSLSVLMGLLLAGLPHAALATPAEPVSTASEALESQELATDSEGPEAITQEPEDIGQDATDLESVKDAPPTASPVTIEPTDRAPTTAPEAKHSLLLVEPPLLRSDFTPTDGILAGLSGFGMGLAGMGVGALTGGAIAAMVQRRDGSEDGWGAAIQVLGVGAMVALPAGLAATAGGVYLYGEGNGYNGNYWLSLAGAGTGFATAILTTGIVGVAGGSEFDGAALAFVISSAILVPVGATLGYYWSLDNAAPTGDDIVTGPALFNVSKRAWGMGVPNVSLLIDPEEHVRGASMSLLSGAF